MCCVHLAYSYISRLLYITITHPYKVVSVNFRPFFRNETKPVKKEKFYTNYINVDFPENIFTHGSDTINEVHSHAHLLYNYVKFYHFLFCRTLWLHVYTLCMKISIMRPINWINLYACATWIVKDTCIYIFLAHWSIYQHSNVNNHTNHLLNIIALIRDIQ